MVPARDSYPGTMSRFGAEGAAGSDFDRAAAAVRSMRFRPELELAEAPAPKRMAPAALAVTAEVLLAEDELGTGRLVVLDAAGVSQLALIPSREELLSKLAYVMQAPVAGMARAFAALAEKKQAEAA